MILIRQFYPIFLLFLAWLSVMVVRNTFFLDFVPISADAKLYLILFFVVAVFGYLLGSVGIFFPERGAGETYSLRSVNVKANWLIFFALVSVFFALVKFYYSVGFSGFSLNIIAEYRQLRARDDGDVKGGSIFGVISAITSAFIVVLYVYGIYFKRYLSRRKVLAIKLVFFFGLAISFLGGGRFSAAISVLFIFLFSLCHYACQRKDGAVSGRYSRAGSKWGRKIIYVIPIFALFSYMFVVRFTADGRGDELILSYLNSGLPGVAVPDDVERYVSDSSFLLLSYFVLAMFLYYFGHSFYQFDVLLQYGIPESAPYALAYQLYPFALFFNRLGSEIIPIEFILNELPNAGTYFSLAGAFYLDFGYWGAFIAIFFLLFVGALAWGWMLRRGGFLSLYFSSMFLVLLIFSPIVGVVGTAIYPSLIAVSLFLWAFVPARSR
nr:O-antigen polymerase [uncultured Pseudomonas sp.]